MTKKNEEKPDDLTSDTPEGGELIQLPAQITGQDQADDLPVGSALPTDEQAAELDAVQVLTHVADLRSILSAVMPEGVTVEDVFRERHQQLRRQIDLVRGLVELNLIESDEGMGIPRVEAVRARRLLAGFGLTRTYVEKDGVVIRSMTFEPNDKFRTSYKRDLSRVPRGERARISLGEWVLARQDEEAQGKDELPFVVRVVKEDPLPKKQTPLLFPLQPKATGKRQI